MRSVPRTKKQNPHRTGSASRQKLQSKKVKKTRTTTTAPSDGLLSNPIRDYDTFSKGSLSDVIRKMVNSGGFESVNLADGIEILRAMKSDSDCTRFLSFVGSLASTGTRGIIRELVRERMFDCIITTCGALDHDIARTYASYYGGDFRLDDLALLKENIHRLGNVIVPFASYGPVIERKVRACLDEMYTHKDMKSLGASEILDFIGSTLDTSSFLYWAHQNKIPVIVPGIVDGAVGSQLWMFQQEHGDFFVNILKDQTRLSDIVYDAKRTGAFMIGGGISKHHTLWWNQFRGGLDYAVYLTSSPEWDGSLSGALVEEAVSWGKITAKASRVTIHGEATTLLPFIYAALCEKA